MEQSLMRKVGFGCRTGCRWRYTPSTITAYTMICVLFMASFMSAYAQLPNKVGSLLTADRSLARFAADETPYEALLGVTDKETVFFAPGPVEGLKYMKNRPNIPDLMYWEPTFAGIAKSMELGFTTGPVAFQRIGVPQRHGEYLTIWKRDRKGEWKISVHATVEHYGNERHQALLSDAIHGSKFIEPDSSGYLKHRSQVRLNQRKDVVSSNDRLFSTVLKSDNQYAFQEFLADDVRFFFPWTNPIQGKQHVLDFLKTRKIDIATEFRRVDRAYSGELAYTYGDAQVRLSPEQAAQNYNYIRIWQRQPDHQWRVIIEFYSER